jgi:hypothetical protein
MANRPFASTIIRQATGTITFPPEILAAYYNIKKAYFSSKFHLNRDRNGGGKRRKGEGKSSAGWVRGESVLPGTEGKREQIEKFCGLTFQGNYAGGSTKAGRGGEKRGSCGQSLYGDSKKAKIKNRYP